MILKGFIKQPVIKQNQISIFLFSLTTVWVFFLIPYQSVSKFWKIVKILSIKIEKIWKYW